ncbi:MAG: neprosin family prolyl endopeptidase [Myxococcaceae bacterium]
MPVALVLTIGALLASGARCEPQETARASPPGGVFAALGGPALVNVEACPRGTVRAAVAPSPVDVLPPAEGSTPEGDGCQPQGCWAWAGWNDRREMRGAGARLSIEVPATTSPDHSLAEVSLQWGKDEADIVEVGWEVAPRRYADAGPHLFVHRWVAGRPCDDGCPFVQSSARLAPGMSLAAWVGKSVAVGWLLWEGRAWAWVDGEWLGAFELGPGAPPAAGVAQWFGEVFFVRSSPGVAMGNGRPSGAQDAARFDQVCDVPPEVPSCIVRAARFPRVTRPDRYSLQRDRAGAFRYGGPGNRAPGAPLTPRPPPSSASEGTPSARGTSAPSRPR